tara:strand:- start:14 stop:310 length:297 start_codon:yes stop_codon:yes gene_type:complete
MKKQPTCIQHPRTRLVCPRCLASENGKKSYKSKLARLGIDELQRIARKNGRKGGRPVGTGGKYTKRKRKTRKRPKITDNIAATILKTLKEQEKKKKKK